MRFKSHLLRGKGRVLPLTVFCFPSLMIILGLLGLRTLRRSEAVVISLEPSDFGLWRRKTLTCADSWGNNLAMCNEGSY